MTSIVAIDTDAVDYFSAMAWTPTSAAPPPDVAQRGDRDLHMQVNDLIISSVIRDEGLVLIRLVDGDGYLAPEWCLDEDHADREMLTNVEVDLTLHLDRPSEEILAEYEQTLIDWRDNQTRLRLFGAPGKVSMLWEGPGRWLPVPSVPPPDDVDPPERRC